jgi:hypothetical protein
MASGNCSSNIASRLAAICFTNAIGRNPAAMPTMIATEKYGE